MYALRKSRLTGTRMRAVSTGCASCCANSGVAPVVMNAARRMLERRFMVPSCLLRDGCNEAVRASGRVHIRADHIPAVVDAEDARLGCRREVHAAITVVVVLESMGKACRVGAS